MLSRGAVVAVARLVDVLQVLRTERGILLYSEQTSYQRLPDEPELSFGDYSPGRFAWLLADIRPLSQPIPARGAQGLWDWQVPEGVVLP